jgi:DNA-binding IclR family transcriptional regulator
VPELSRSAERVLEVMPPRRPRTVRWLAHFAALPTARASAAVAELVRAGLVERLSASSIVRTSLGQFQRTRKYLELTGTIETQKEE